MDFKSSLKQDDETTLKIAEKSMLIETRIFVLCDILRQMSRKQE